MKTALQWKNEFCNKHIINVRGNFMEEFIKKIQDDALESRRLTGNTEKLIPPDIMEKARELETSIYMLTLGYQYRHEEFVDLIAAALAEARAVPQWLPIESAPYHGIILVTNGNGTWPCRYKSGPYGEGFYEMGKEHCSPVGSPTHWQPLPPAPNPEMAASGDKRLRGEPDRKGVSDNNTSSPNPPIAAGGK